ncbi:hypothetical protein SH467x_003119 [Pirellulaceae bacterium SH467]
MNKSDYILVRKRRLLDVFIIGVVAFCIPIFYRLVDPTGKLSDEMNSISRLDPNPMGTFGYLMIMLYVYLRVFAKDVGETTFCPTEAKSLDASAQKLNRIDKGDFPSESGK